VAHVPSPPADSRIFPETYQELKLCAKKTADRPVCLQKHRPEFFSSPARVKIHGRPLFSLRLRSFLRQEAFPESRVGCSALGVRRFLLLASRSPPRSHSVLVH